MAHLDKIQWIVEEQGWCAEPVAGSDDPPRPPYTYTYGFEESYGHPEVVIFGLQPVAARGLMTMMAEYLEAGGELPVGEFRGLLDNDLRAAILPILLDDHLDLFDGLTAYYAGTNYRVRQFLWPDRQGLLPWDEGYDERLRLAQPVIGVTE